MEATPRLELGVELLQSSALPLGYVADKTDYAPEGEKIPGEKIGAGDEARTRYLHLGKVALYQMSYTRIFAACVTDPAGGNSVGWAGPPNGVLMVPPVGIEPTTRGFSVPCSTN